MLILVNAETSRLSEQLAGSPGSDSSVYAFLVVLSSAKSHPPSRI